MSRLTLALDVMGGDFGPRVVFPAIEKALVSDLMLDFLLCGDQSSAEPFLSKLQLSYPNRIRFIHCSNSSNSVSEKTTTNSGVSLRERIRESKGSSLHVTIEALRNGDAHGCVSAGDTALLLGLAKVLLPMIDGVRRPALVSCIPTIDAKQTVMLDLGANIDCSAEDLMQFACMGSVFATHFLGVSLPKVALLNIGTEDFKGTKYIREASVLIKKYLNYVGYIEGDRILNGDADVIVSDGLTGNVALKTLEGAAKNIVSLLKNDYSATNLRKLFLCVGRYLFKGDGEKLNQYHPDRHNGASLLGLRYVVVKSHGGANQEAFFNAIQYAAKQVRLSLPLKIEQGLIQ